MSQESTICPRCGCNVDKYQKPYQQTEILLQTPQSVWTMYRENGYTIAQAIREEMSYA